MKKIVALILAMAMIACMFVGCKDDTSKDPDPTTEGTEAPTTEGTEAPTTEGTEAPASDWRVAMITDYGDITDQSFNQATYEGAQAYCNANGVDFTYYKPTDDSTAARVASIDQAVAEGYNVLLMPGFAFAGAIAETVEMYPDVKYIALDVSAGDLEGEGMSAPYPENLFCAVYQEELAGYMAGYAAVKMGYTKLGFLGGMAVPAVVRYGYGFVQGADAAAVELNKTGDVSVNYAYGNQFFGDADITAYMDTWYGADTEIVFACGGGIWASAAEAAAKQDGKKVIGVDVDQAATIDTYGEGMTVTSAMKGLAATVQTVLGDLVAGNWGTYAGQVMNLGLVSGDDVEANYVQLPLESTQWNDTFTQDDYKALVAAMFDGTVTVSADIEAEPTTTIAVDYQGNIK